MSRGYTEKYRSFRGPHPGEPTEKQVAFWSKDLTDSQEWYKVAFKSGNTNEMRRALNAVKEAQDNLRRLAA